MDEVSELEQSYLTLIEFLLLSKRRVIELGDEHDLTAMQSMTMLLLDQPRQMNSFTKIFNCDPSNVTGLVDGLEKKQLAERCPSPNDRRLKMVQLTKDGIAMRASLVRELTGPSSYLLKNLTPTEITQFIQLVQKITQPTAVADAIKLA